ncbi:MAG TPA: hypothetical protein VMV92_40330 [Streptosporangiaceae bacterium]|nr:hypothetical protein [Streptosporangiaceae bacterium]
MTRFPVLPPGKVHEATGRDGLVLLDVWQETCPPCRTLEPRRRSPAGTPARSPATASTSTLISRPRPGTT